MSTVHFDIKKVASSLESVQKTKKSELSGYDIATALQSQYNEDRGVICKAINN